MSFSTAPAPRIVVGALWAVIGYVYTGDVVSGAVVWGGAMVAAGWGLVAAAVATKVSSAQDAAASKQCTERQLDPGECVVMTVDIGRLGEAVRQRRAELGISQVELWKAGGPSNSTLTNIESDRDVPVHPKTLRKLDFALGWPTGWTYLALHGDGDSAERPCVRSFDTGTGNSISRHSLRGSTGSSTLRSWPPIRPIAVASCETPDTGNTGNTGYAGCVHGRGAVRTV